MAKVTQKLGRVAVVPRGEWDGGAAYERLDVVTSGGSSYMATRGVPAGTPVTDAAWQKLAAKGEKGDDADIAGAQAATKAADDAAAAAASAAERADSVARSAALAAGAASDAATAAVAAASQARDQASAAGTAASSANAASGDAAAAASKATSAATAAERATEEATRAASSASNAASTANEAAGAASNAATSATTATEKATGAAAAADAAKGNAEKAASDAAAAADSATKAASAATDAAEKATKATESATAGAKSASDAATAAGTAKEAAAAATEDAQAATAAASAATDRANAAAAKAEAWAGGTLEWDAEAGEYAEDGLRALIARNSDALLYGVSIPKSAATACTKTHANAGIANPVPSTLASPGTDPYSAINGPFLHIRCNGIVDPDGRPHVTALEGDPRYAADGSNGDVWVMAPVLWWSMEDAGETMELAVSDTYRPGLKAQPKAYLPDGSLRPYMLYAAYGGSKGADGSMHSVSGAQQWVMTVSHNSLIDITKSATTGYSGKSLADDWYPKVMFLLKYAVKSSQSVFNGCVNYAYGYAPALAETGVNRVVLAKAQAANFIVGSSVMLGTADGKGAAIDRGQAAARDVFDARTVLRVEAVDDATSAVVVGGEPFDTATTMWLQTAPWPTGCCDGVRGDGSPYSVTNGREPYVLQGIEMSYGAYEILSDVVLKGDGEHGQQVFTVADTARASKSAPTADYRASGTFLPGGDTDAWRWPAYPVDADGYLVGQGAGGSSTSGMGDGIYSAADSNKDARCLLSLGALWFGPFCGLFFVYGNAWLGGAGWGYASRLSGTGRSGVNAA